MWKLVLALVLALLAGIIALAIVVPSVALAFLSLLAVAWGLRYLGRRLIPLAMPAGMLKTLAVGMVGGLVGSLLLPWGPTLWEINLPGAVLGSALFILFLGALPFLRILIGLRKGR